MERDFRTQFNEAMTAKGVSVVKLSELSGIPERYIEILRSGNYEALPPSPYVRGYLTKIAAILGANSEEWWRVYRAEEPVKTSGAADRLPRNRFSMQKLNKTKIGIAAAIVLVLGYGIFRGSAIIGKPFLSIENPNVATLITSVDHLTVSGSVKSGDKLSVNGESEYVSGDGHFEKEIRLFPGINNIEFKVKRPLGREVSEIRKVIYQPDLSGETSVPATAPETSTASTTKNK